MLTASREFQVFVKPAGPDCNLACAYCYYLPTRRLYPRGGPARMPPGILETYIRQHLEAHPGPVVHFSWHGGEPTLSGTGFFLRVVALQQRHRPPGVRITNGIQTNGTLLDGDWCRFLAEAGFGVGLSLDGPADLHDPYRVDRSGDPTHGRVLQAYECLRHHGVPVDILCVVHAHNVGQPRRVYDFFKGIGAGCLTFLPLVARRAGPGSGVDPRSVAPEAWGDFLCRIFDPWARQDIGRVEVQIFDEVAAAACGREHALCIFRETCGEIPVVEHNGDVYACDHFVDTAHRLGNIGAAHLAGMIESPAQRAFGRLKRDALPRYCLACEVLAMCNGGCPKDRILTTADGQPGLNWLCAGYKRFFTHCAPFAAQLAALSRPAPPAKSRDAPPRPALAAVPAPGRNAPCPCGSGRKYKRCCLGK